MFDKNIDIDFLVESEPKEVVIKHIKELQYWLDWYAMWHEKHKKQIEELTTELETYRPTKLEGEGLTTCNNCKKISWTSFGFYSYKGHILCDNCLKKLYSYNLSKL